MQWSSNSTRSESSSSSRLAAEQCETAQNTPEPQLRSLGQDTRAPRSVPAPAPAQVGGPRLPVALKRHTQEREHSARLKRLAEQSGAEDGLPCSGPEEGLHDQSKLRIANREHRVGQGGGRSV